MRWMIVCALALAGCASTPCLSTVTTSVESGITRAGGTDNYVDFGVRNPAPLHGRSRERGYDIRGGVALEWDATGVACADTP